MALVVHSITSCKIRSYLSGYKFYSSHSDKADNVSAEKDVHIGGVAEETSHQKHTQLVQHKKMQLRIHHAN